MTGIINKLRDLVEDNYVYTTDSFEYITSTVFSLSEPNVDTTTLVCYNNGELWATTGVAGSAVAWARSGTVVTITKTAHALISGDAVVVTVTSASAALPLGTYTVTKLTADTFSVVGLNAGATSGTCTYTVTANWSYSTTTGKVTVTGALVVADNLQFCYNAYEKYSDTELKGYIRGAMVRISVEHYKDFVDRCGSIFPTPSENEENLMAFVAAVLIKGSINQYRTPDLTIIFANEDAPDKKIKSAIRQFTKSLGYLDYIDPGDEQAMDDED